MAESENNFSEFESGRGNINYAGYSPSTSHDMYGGQVSSQNTYGAPVSSHDTYGAPVSPVVSPVSDYSQSVSSPGLGQVSYYDSNRRSNNDQHKSFNI